MVATVFEKIMLEKRKETYDKVVMKLKEAEFVKRFGFHRNYEKVMNSMVYRKYS